MITDEDVQRFFRGAQWILDKHYDPSKQLPSQFYRGTSIWVDQHPGGCRRHLAIFDEFNIIPKYCFSCYKVIVTPRTVLELFKLMMVFEAMRLPNDNTRKCIVECREKISGTYKGFVYCRSIKEGEELVDTVRQIISDEISNEIPVTLKRGCSEYGLVYPEFPVVAQGSNRMEYIEAWREQERIADDKLQINTKSYKYDTYNRADYTLQDVLTMLYWLRYAATIGDTSYLKIFNQELPPDPDLKRPAFVVT